MSSRYHVQVVHYPTPPGTDLLFFLKTRRVGDPQECQRLVPLDTAQLTALAQSIEAASLGAKALMDARGETSFGQTGHA